MRSPVTALIDQFHNLTPEEAKVFLDLVDPQPEPEPAAKQARKKRGPSKKQQSLSAAISRAPKADAGGTENAEPAGPLCNICGHPEDFQDHFAPSPNYHDPEFPKAKKASAQK